MIFFHLHLPSCTAATRFATERCLQNQRRRLDPN